MKYHAKTYEPDVGLLSASTILVQELLSAWFAFVLLIATQKTNATRRTIKVYSTKPCPSSSTTNLFSSSIVLSPPFFTTIDY